MKRLLIATILLLSFGAFGALFKSHAITQVNYQVGEKIDSLNGVFVYYNGSVANVVERNTTKDGYNLGLKYQCVEFVKRYYYEYFHHKMPNSYGHAKDFYNKKFPDGTLNTERNLIQFKNGGNGIPQANDLVVWNGNEWNPYGHVAIVVKNVNNKHVEIIQQNPGPGAPSRINLNLIPTSKGYKIENDEIFGWLHKN